MRRVSEKRQGINRAAQPVRDKLKEDFPCCPVCRRRETTDTHEISRGPARQKSLGERCALIAACRRCHDRIQNWTVAKQLALKALIDVEHYDREKVNELIGRNLVDERDVWMELPSVILEIRWRPKREWEKHR